MNRLQKQRVQDLLGGEISEEDLALLLDDIDNSPEMRKELAEMLEMRGLLVAALTSEDDLKLLRDSVRTAVASTPDVNAFRQGILDEVRGSQATVRNQDIKRPGRLPHWWWLAAAAAVAISASLLWQPKTNPVVATITVAGAGFDLERGDRVVSVQTGMTLLDRDMLRGSAATEKLTLTYADGTEAVIAGNSELGLRNIDGAKHLHLHYGKIMLDVRPQPAGKALLVTTQHARAKVVGTKLTVITDDRATKLHVSSGTVLFQNLLEDQALVEAGHSAVAIVGEQRLRRTIPELAASPNDRKRYEEWKQWAEAIAKDPTTIAYYDFEEDDYSAGRLTNKAVNFGADSLHVRNVDGRIRTCSWTRGRFAGLKQALLFQDVGFVDLSNDHSLRLTEPPIAIFLWFKVPSFTIARQPLLARGDYSWRLERHEETDRLAFHVHGVKKNEVVTTASAVNDEQWHLVVATYDGERLNIYLDGMLESSLPATGRIKRKTGTAGTHVLLGANADLPQRDFQGWIDEVGILNRRVTADEVRQMWELGK